MITDTLERARSAYDRLPSESPTFTHGDFKADHLWVSRGGLTLLDFGSCALGDPALDIGKFLADLQWWSALSGRASASAQRAFLASYATGSEARLLRARVYEALFLVMCAAHRVPLYHSAWAARSARLVQQAGAVLDQLP
jgi:aminoglycoside phosphotransferase (APT) family kinase protein